MAVDTSNATLIAEYRLLNKIYLHPEILDDPLYNRDIFIHTSCKSIADSIDKITKDGTTLEKLSIYNEVAKVDMNVSIDTIETICNMSTDADATFNDIAEILKDTKKGMETVSHLNNIKDKLDKGLALTDKDKDYLRKEFDKAEEKLFSFDNTSKHVMNMKEWGDQWQEDFDDRKNGKKYYFNEEVFDDLVTDGPCPGTGGILVAQSGMGKSTAVLKLTNGFINAEIPCMLFSLEMGGVPTFDRLLASRLQIPYKSFVNPDSPEEFEALRQQAEAERVLLEENKKFRFCEDANLSLGDIRRAIIKFQNEIGQKYCVVMIDLITMVKEFSSNATNMAQAIEIAVNKLNAMAKELGIHYIGTAQLNRKGEEDKIVDPDDVYRFRPTRNQVKNSGALLERARYTISFFRKKYYLKQFFPEDEELMASPDAIEIQVLKQNDGECARRYELFDGSTFSMTPMLDTEEN